MSQHRQFFCKTFVVRSLTPLHPPPPAATIHFCNSRPDLKLRLVPSILVEVTSSYSGLQGQAWEILIEIQPGSPLLSLSANCLVGCLFILEWRGAGCAGVSAPREASFLWLAYSATIRLLKRWKELQSWEGPARWCLHPITTTKHFPSLSLVVRPAGDTYGGCAVLDLHS